MKITNKEAKTMQIKTAIFQTLFCEVSHTLLNKIIKIGILTVELNYKKQSIL